VRGRCQRRLGPSLPDLAQADAGHAGDAELEEAAPTQAVAVLPRRTQIQTEHGRPRCMTRLTAAPGNWQRESPGSRPTFTDATQTSYVEDKSNTSGSPSHAECAG